MSEPQHKTHAAHRGKGQQLTVADWPFESLPSHLLHPESEVVHALLEQLDDVIFSALSGDQQAFAEAQLLWPQVVLAIGWELVEESREQYLRFAIDVIQRLEIDGDRCPERALAALDIVLLLTED